MATATFKLTSHSTVKLTYNIENVSNTATRLTVTGYTYTNNRTTGTLQKLWLDIYGYYYQTDTAPDSYYVPDSTSFAIAKGTKSKSGSITRWCQWNRTHSARTGKFTLCVEMWDADGDWYKELEVSVSVPAKPSYTVTYNANGGSGAPGAGTKWYGETLTLSSTQPTWSGHTFKGWGTSKTATTVAYAKGAKYTANAAITLYAIWTCTISYNANDGSGAPDSQTKYAYTNINLQTGKPTRAGYAFKGWASSSGGSVAYQPGAAYSGTSGVTLYAVWAVTPPSVSVKVERAIRDNTVDPPTYTPSLVGGYGLVTVTYSLSSATQLDAVSCSVGGESAALVSSGGTTMVYASASQHGLSEQPTVEVSVSDAASNVTTKATQLPTASPPIHFKPGGAGVGIGEPAEWDGLRVAMKSYFGRYPVEDTADNYPLIIGNGTADDARSNTLAVRWTGDGTSYNTPGVLAVFSQAIDGSVTPSSNTYTRLLSGVAANDEVFGNISMYRSADSYNVMLFEAQNAKSDGTFVWNTLKLGVKDDGTRWVGVSDAAAWRKALGANSSGAWPLDYGGTGATDAAGARTNLGLKALAQKASVSFSTTNVSKTSSKGSVAGGASIALSTPVTSPGTGYYATGALGVNSNHNSACVVNMFDGDTVKVRNTGSSTLSDITATLSFKYGRVTVS